MLLLNGKRLLRDFLELRCATALGILAEERDGLLVTCKLCGEVSPIESGAMRAPKLRERRLLLGIRLLGWRRYVRGLSGGLEFLPELRVVLNHLLGEGLYLAGLRTVLGKLARLDREDVCARDLPCEGD